MNNECNLIQELVFIFAIVFIGLVGGVMLFSSISFIESGRNIWGEVVDMEKWRAYLKHDKEKRKNKINSWRKYL